uniref:Elongation of very long chain fatty acids protein n=1 Tax=Rhabditophanes sp. KR3021 TaxID=114890 RepID=A0AC35TQY4_9BILA
MSNFIIALNNFTIYQNGSMHSMHSDYQYGYVFPFEFIHNYADKTRWFQRNWYHSITLSLIYFTVILILQRIMRDRKPFCLKNSLFFWNLGLCIFSTMGFIRFTENLLFEAGDKGLQYVVCYSWNTEGPAIFWSLMFLISKVFEFGDTVFIVLRKKPLIFLHYYHHAAVLVYTVHAAAEHTASGAIFISMNFFVHSIMYGYYAISSLQLFRMPKYISITITSLQLLQMVIGVSTTLYVYYIKTNLDVPCQQSMANLYLAFLMYLSFGILFAYFFFNAYCKKQNKLKTQ